MSDESKVESEKEKVRVPSTFYFLLSTFYFLLSTFYSSLITLPSTQRNFFCNHSVNIVSIPGSTGREASE